MVRTGESSFVISAPSGAGKTTLIKKLLKNRHEFDFSISTTTRKSRKNEQEDVDYYFVDENSFKESIDNNEFVEWAFVHGNYYGTYQKEIDRIRANGKIPLFDVDIQGAEQLRDRLVEATFIFIVPPSLAILETRLRNRKTESEEQIKLRLKNSKKELAKYNIFDYIIINDNLGEAFRNLLAIIDSECCKLSQMEEVIKKMLEDNK